MTEPEFLTVKEVADLLRTTPETLRYWAWRGDGPKSFKTGRRRLFAREDVNAYIAEARAMPRTDGRVRKSSSDDEQSDGGYVR